MSFGRDAMSGLQQDWMEEKIDLLVFRVHNAKTPILFTAVKIIVKGDKRIVLALDKTHLKWRP
jgi:hypothetical protein